MASEIWKPVVGYEGLYEVSNTGRVRSLSRFVNSKNGSLALKRGRVLTQFRAKKGYLEARLSRHGRTKTLRVNRIVCAAFHGPPPEGYEAAHLDGSKDNNTESNLRWKTGIENAADRKKHGTYAMGEQVAHLAKLTAEQVLDIRARYQPRYGALADLAREFGVSPTAIMQIVRRRHWKHI